MKPLIEGTVAATTWLGAIVFDEHALVPVGTIIVLGGGIWWLGRKLQALEDGQKTLQDGQDRLNRRVDKLPCGSKACDT